MACVLLISLALAGFIIFLVTEMIRARGQAPPPNKEIRIKCLALRSARPPDLTKPQESQGYKANHGPYLTKYFYNIGKLEMKCFYNVLISPISVTSQVSSCIRRRN